MSRPPSNGAGSTTVNGMLVPRIGAHGMIDPGVIPELTNACFDKVTVDGPITVTHIYEDKLFIGGAFKTVNGQPRNRLACLDKRTGELLSWDAGLDGFVDDENISALLASNGRLYVGFHGFGDVTTTVADGSVRRGFVCLSTHDGRTCYNHDLGVTNGHIQCFMMIGRTLYAGGSFLYLGKQEVYGGFSVNTDTWELNSWNPGITEGGCIWAMLPAPNRSMLIFGEFTTVHGIVRGGTARIDSLTGGIDTTFADSIGDPVTPFVHYAVVDEKFVYCFGTFTKVNGKPKKYVAKISRETGVAVDNWGPDLHEGDFTNKALMSPGSIVLCGWYLTSKLPGHSLLRVNTSTGNAVPVHGLFVTGSGKVDPAHLSSSNSGDIDRNSIYFATWNFDDDTDPRRFWLRKIDLNTMTQVPDSTG